MVKILRKKLKHKNGYWFKTPYKTAKIIQKVIDKLRECEQENNVNDFLKKCDCTGYREILIAEQFVAIKKASEGRRKKVVKLADDLKNITVKVGDNARLETLILLVIKILNYLDIISIEIYNE